MSTLPLTSQYLQFVFTIFLKMILNSSRDPGDSVHICSISFHYGVKWCVAFFLLLSLIVITQSPSIGHHELLLYSFHTCIIKSPPLQTIESHSQHKLNPANINLQQEPVVEVLYWDVWAGGSELNQWRKVTGYPSNTTQSPQPHTRFMF